MAEYRHDWSIVCDECDVELNSRGAGYVSARAAALDGKLALEKAIDNGRWTTDGLWLHCPDCPKLEIRGITLAAAMHRKEDVLEEVLADNLVIL